LSTIGGVEIVVVATGSEVVVAGLLVVVVTDDDVGSTPAVQETATKPNATKTDRPFTGGDYVLVSMNVWNPVLAWGRWLQSPVVVHNFAGWPR